MDPKDWEAGDMIREASEPPQPGILPLSVMGSERIWVNPSFMKNVARRRTERMRSRLSGSPRLVRKNVLKN